MRINGYITRLIAGEGGEADRIFLQPDPETDLRYVDGKHRTGAGELVVEAPLEGRNLGERITVEVSGEADPNLTTLRVV